MVNTNKLKGAIVANEKTQQEVAELIGIDRSTFYRKMDKGGSFTVEEASKMADMIPLTDSEAIAIFFGGTVANVRHKKKYKKDE